MQTYVPTLEMSGAKVYTRKIFFKYREALRELSSVHVDGSKRTASTVIYIVKKFGLGSGRRRWHVSHLLRFLNIHDLPDSMVCNRWKKNAKEWLEGSNCNDDGNAIDLSNRMNRLGALARCCRRLCSVGCRSLEDFNNVREVVIGLTEKLLATNHSSLMHEMGDGRNAFPNVQDPSRVRTKGRPPMRNSVRSKTGRKMHKCSGCRKVGHNIKRCPFRSDVEDSAVGAASGTEKCYSGSNGCEGYGPSFGTSDDTGAED
ncbi:hypothetical protein RIF29_40670 [Crotalaria pallida]|uniref:Uncharacterized protein n=1 Tax=Crotalaria pallida TaxID=3830 RepID=A0AAN9E3I6_CROPI